MSLVKKALAALTAFALVSGLLAQAAYADPPRHAPAHGWRDKQDQRHDKRHYSRHYDRHYHHERQRPYRYYDGRRGAYPVVTHYAVTEIDCTRTSQTGQILGAILGGVSGGVVGNQFGKGSGRDLATIGGAVAGLLVGANLGGQFDSPMDRACAGRVFETVNTGHQVAWANPDQDARYALVPTHTFTGDDGRYCREYQSVATIGGRTQQTYGTACRQPDGSWEIVSR